MLLAVVKGCRANGKSLLLMLMPYYQQMMFLRVAPFSIISGKDQYNDIEFGKSHIGQGGIMSLGIEPTSKAPEIEAILTTITGKDRPTIISGGKCIFCNAQDLKPESFKGALSIREYSISGMCQACQDATFEEIPEE